MSNDIQEVTGPQIETVHNFLIVGNEQSHKEEIAKSFKNFSNRFGEKIRVMLANELPLKSIKEEDIDYIVFVFNDSYDYSFTEVKFWIRSGLNLALFMGRIGFIMTGTTHTNEWGRYEKIKECAKDISAHYFHVNPKVETAVNEIVSAIYEHFNNASLSTYSNLI